MKILERLTTYEQSLRLKELGINQVFNYADFFYSKNKDDEEMSLFLYGEKQSAWLSDFLEPKIEPCVEKEFENDILIYTYEKEYMVKSFDEFQVSSYLPKKLGELYFDTFEHPTDENLIGYGYCHPMMEDVRVYGKTHLEAKTELLIHILDQGFIILN